MSEIIFISKGNVDIGYEINKQRRFVLRYSDRGIFGGYNCTFNTRSIFIYRCKTDCEGYFIRKDRWLELIGMDPDIESILKNNIKHDYNSKIKYKVWKVKEKHI